MFRNISLFLCILLLCLVSEARPQRTYKVIYEMGGPFSKKTSQVDLYINGPKIVISRENFQKHRPLVSITYADYKKNEWYRTESFPDSSVYTTVAKMKKTDDFQFIGVDNILEYECRHVRTSVNSNSIDIWYSESFPQKGTPQPDLGALDGLVLKIARNGHVLLEAKSIEELEGVVKDFPQERGKIISKSELKYLEDQLEVTEVKIFDKERIAFTGKENYKSFDSDIVYKVGGGTVILRKVSLPKNKHGHCIFAEVTQYSDGDAYDRTGSVFLIPADRKNSFLQALKDSVGVLPAPFVSGNTSYPGIVSTPEYSVPIELVRFFTSFGVRKFNYHEVWGQKWADSVLYKQEITHLAPLLEGDVWIAAYIGNWDKNGHILSLKIKYYPEEDAHPSSTVIPLFNTLNILEQAGQKYPSFMDKDSLHMKINVDKPVKNAKLVYISTGHGGWGGGDEFNQKLNRIFLDGKLKYAYIPWRSDCATYRSLNPCSGNFPNGLSSSDYSRSNWCPGTVTQPAFIPIGDIEPGEHEFVISIDQGSPEGSSISYWCISGVIIAD